MLPTYMKKVWPNVWPSVHPALCRSILSLCSGYCLANPECKVKELCETCEKQLNTTENATGRAKLYIRSNDPKKERNKAYIKKLEQMITSRTQRGVTFTEDDIPDHFYDPEDNNS